MVLLYNEPVTDPKGATSGTIKINRGSSWSDDASKARSAHRGGFASDSWHNKVGFRLAYMQVNAPPSFLDTIDGLSIMENQPVGTEVGQLSASDQDGDTLSYVLINGTGATHNQNFSLDANGVLKANRTFDFENDSIVQSIRVSVTDPLNASAESVFSITLSDLNEVPFGLSCPITY